MTEYIEREPTLFNLHNHYPKPDDMIASVVTMPTVDAVPVKHGRWIKNDNGTWSCERCHSWIPDEQHYYARFCLYCGAKLDGGAKDAVDN